MKLLSIDVGIKNLAMVIIDTETLGISFWECDGVPIESEDGLFPSLVEHLNKRDFTEVQQVIIERQPQKNHTIKSVENLLHTYFLCKGIPVRLWDAKHKIPDIVGPGKRQYAKRKKASVERCLEHIKTSNTHLVDFFQSHKKQDDLADCFMQALSYCGTKMTAIKKKEDRSKKPRAPTENQTATKYSRANLAWLVLQDKHHTARFHKDLKRYYSSLEDLLDDFKNVLRAPR